MNSNEKKWIVLAIIVLLVIVLVVLIINGIKKNENLPTSSSNVVENEDEIELDDGTKINVSESFNKPKKYNDLEISNIQFTEKDGISVLLADIKNNSNTIHEAEIVNITILGENGEEIAKITPVIGKINAGETIKLNASISADVTKAKDFTIEEKK